jgi:succinate dehydrogenase hydrophobic anchor subunit
MAKFFKPIAQLCTPAKVYLVIAAVSILASFMTDSILGIVFHAGMTMLWAFFLGWLCDSGHPGVSWFLVIWLPALMFIFLIFGFVYLMSLNQEERKALKLKVDTKSETDKESTDNSSSTHNMTPENFHPSMFGGSMYHGVEGMKNKSNDTPNKEQLKKMADIAKKAINSQGKTSLSG